MMRYWENGRLGAAPFRETQSNAQYPHSGALLPLSGLGLILWARDPPDGQCRGLDVRGDSLSTAAEARASSGRRYRLLERLFGTVADGVYSSDSDEARSFRLQIKAASWLAAGLAPRWRWSTQNRRPGTTQASPPTGGPNAGLISAPLPSSPQSAPITGFHKRANAS